MSLLREIKKIYKLCGQHAWHLGFGILLALIASSADLLMPLGIRELLNAVFQNGDRSLLNWIALGLLGLFLGQAVFGSIGRYLLKRTSEYVVADLRKRVYSHLHDLSISYFSNERIGDLTSRLSNDVSSVRAAISRGSVSLLADGLKLIGSVALMVMLNWRLSLITFAIMPAAVLLARHLGKKIRRLSREVQDILADVTAMAEQALSAIRVVKAFSRGDYERERYRGAVDRLYNTSRRKILIRIIFSSLITLSFSVALVGVFWFGGIEVLANRLSAGDLVAFVIYAQNVADGTRGLSSLYSTFNSAAGASSRLFELLGIEPEVSAPTDSEDLPPISGHVFFHDVSFGYEDDKLVLRDINLEVEPGSTVALVGPSGAGKTTFMHLIPRFFDPTSGRIEVDGYDIRKVQLKSLREQIALVSQEVRLFDDTILNNIRYGRLDATEEGIRKAARDANAEGFVLALSQGFETQVGERGAKLSGGQRQRIAIARALLRDAGILLLDEATSSLDSASEAKVQQALNRLTENRTTFVIAHRLSTVRNADRILVMNHGRIVEDGTHVELTAQGGLYENMASYQLRDDESELVAA